jgi:undecaprenyl-diphosphatase
MLTPDAIDLGALFFFRGLQRDATVEAARAVTALGDRWLLGLVASAAAVGFAIARQARTGLIVGLTLLAAISLTVGVKNLVQRPRPYEASLSYPQETGWSFPSGHAGESAALYGGLSVLLARRLRGRSRLGAGLVAALGVLLPFAIGTTRLFLCFHYVTDVLAGWCAGGALALLCAWADGVGPPSRSRAAPWPRPRRPGPPRPPRP